MRGLYLAVRGTVVALAMTLLSQDSRCPDLASRARSVYPRKPEPWVVGGLVAPQQGPAYETREVFGPCKVFSKGAQPKLSLACSWAYCCMIIF